MLTGTLVLLRYDPEIDAEPHYETYQFPFEPGMTVLDVVRYVYDRIDGTLSFSYGCRTSHCGLCGATINGVAGLMCREPATLELLLEPLRGFPVVRDLMIDREDREEVNSGLRLYLDRVNVPELQPERIAAEHVSAGQSLCRVLLLQRKLPGGVRRRTRVHWPVWHCPASKARVRSAGSVEPRFDGLRQRSLQLHHLRHVQ
jgi:hypothetical protein